jgi:hypothetical protein
VERATPRDDRPPSRSTAWATPSGKLPYACLFVATPVFFIGLPLWCFFVLPPLRLGMEDRGLRPSPPLAFLILCNHIVARHWRYFWLLPILVVYAAHRIAAEAHRGRHEP